MLQVSTQVTIEKSDAAMVLLTVIWFENFAALAALAGSQLRSGGGGAPSGAPQQSQEMAVPNELIGCIIGKGGTKIAEIR